MSPHTGFVSQGRMSDPWTRGHVDVCAQRCHQEKEPSRLWATSSSACPAVTRSPGGCGLLLQRQDGSQDPTWSHQVWSSILCRWNVLGLQGSLLTYFMEPVYLSSLVLGRLYHARHLHRAVYQRLAHVQELPPPFCLNQPLLSGEPHLTSPMGPWRSGVTHARPSVL